jgi:hypothetical protein
MNFATKLYLKTDRSKETFQIGQVLENEPVIFAPDYDKRNSKTAVISGTIATILLGDEGQNYIVLIDGTTIKTWKPTFSEKQHEEKP